MPKLRFGTSGEVILWDAEEPVGSTPIPPHGAPLPSVADALASALSDPIDFPSLEHIVLPDDLVAILIQPGLPCAAELIAGCVTNVMQAGVPAELISILRAPGDQTISNKQLLSELSADVAARITVSEHDPTDREQLSFLGASKNDNAIYVSRVISDAGLVLPIGFHGSSPGIHNSWFPAFSDTETQKRFHKAMASSSEKKIAKQLAECEEAGWMAGIQFVVQLIPAGDNQAMHVLAGLPQAVWKRATSLFEDAWDLNVAEPANLIVAGIGGGPEQQTWDNVACTVDRLLDAVEVDGAIAICSQLKSKPGPALRQLAGAEDSNSAEKAIRRTATSDALAASQLNRSLQRVRVYLLSELRETDVEDLGIAYVSDAKEISKLSSQFESSLVIENAQHVSISRASS